MGPEKAFMKAAAAIGRAKTYHERGESPFDEEIKEARFATERDRVYRQLADQRRGLIIQVMDLIRRFLDTTDQNDEILRSFALEYKWYEAETPPNERQIFVVASAISHKGSMGKVSLDYYVQVDPNDEIDELEGLVRLTNKDGQHLLAIPLLDGHEETPSAAELPQDRPKDLTYAKVMELQKNISSNMDEMQVGINVLKMSNGLEI